MKDERNNGYLDDITDRLYEEDSYIKSFSANVISCTQMGDDLNAITLDRTAFFPGGGGQECDIGRIADANVLNVQIIDGMIIHFTDKPLIVGMNVSCEIDWKLRFRRMQNHSGEHLFCGIIHNEYGYDNVGFHMNNFEVTLDVSGEIPPEKLAEIELKANEAIYENRKIIVSFPSKEECETLAYRSKLDITEGVRLVTIEGYDVCACCAPHLATTAEIGVIKVIDSFYHRGGTRITLRAGISAYEDYQLIDMGTKGLMSLLSSKRYETLEFAIKLDDKCHSLIEENKDLKRQFTQMEAERILEDLKKRDPEDMTPVIIFADAIDNFQMRNVINSIKEKYAVIVAGFMGNDDDGYDYIIGRGEGNDINLSLFAKEFNAAFNGRGGGKPEMIQGHISASEAEIFKFLQNNP